MPFFPFLFCFPFRFSRGAGKYNNKKNQRGRIEKNALPLLICRTRIKRTSVLSGILLNYFFFSLFLRFLRSNSNMMSRIMRSIEMTIHMTMLLLLSVD